MALDWEQGGLAEGLKCYRAREFFLAHEHWEDVWRGCDGRERLFLQALIQITVAMHHISRGNRAGAASLLMRSLRKLEIFPVAFEGVEVEPLRRSVRAWLDTLDDAVGDALEDALDEARAEELPAPPIR